MGVGHINAGMSIYIVTVAESYAELGLAIDI